MGSVDGLGDGCSGCSTTSTSSIGGSSPAVCRTWSALARRVERTIVGVLAEAGRRAVWSEDGHRSVRGRSQATCRWSYGETTARLRTAALLTSCPWSTRR